MERVSCWSAVRRTGVPVLGLCLWLVMTVAGPSRGADPAFVGSLALAVDDDGTRVLGLSDETLARSPRSRGWRS